MGYKTLFVFLEGDDDERFFEKILKPIFNKKYELIRYYKWANSKNEKVDNFLKSIKSMERKGVADYIYLTDIDAKPCITLKKEERKRKHKQLDLNKIVVVIKEIESWYLAGLNFQTSRKLKISSFRKTDNIKKEQFDHLIPERFERADFMVEILKPENFSIDIAKNKNNSFKYFLNKHCF